MADTVHHYKHGWIKIDGDTPGSRSADKLAAKATGKTSPKPMSADQLEHDYRSKVTLTPHEGDVLDNYTGSGYQAINEHLRYGDDPYGVKGDADTLSKLAQRYTLPANTTVFRTVNHQPTHANATGTVFTSQGFSSSTIGRIDVTHKGKPVVMEVTVPKGSHGIVVNGTGAHAGQFGVRHEDELILPHGTRFRVDSDTMRGEQRYMKVTALPPATSSVRVQQKPPAYDDYETMRDGR